MENELTCCVCLDLYTEPLMLPCSHNFCKKCLWDLFHHSRSNQDRQRAGQISCPKCRRDVQLPGRSGIDNLPLNKALDNIVRVYKTSSESESQPSAKKCMSHQKPLSLYCQTCKRTICDACRLQLHSGFGHYTKDITDFILEEKEKARASLHELETIKNAIIARDTDVTMLIVQSKMRETELRGSVVDQFAVIRQCLSVQQSEVLTDVSSQLSQSRVSLEKLAENCALLKSDLRVLRNRHKEALQESDPERQLKLLQSLTLRLSAFLTFRSPAVPNISHASTVKDGCIENVANALAAICQLHWTNTTMRRGGDNFHTRDYGTQTAYDLTNQSSFSNNTSNKQPTKEQQTEQQPASPTKQQERWKKKQVAVAARPIPRGKHTDKKPLVQYLDSATRELRQLTGAREKAQVSQGTPQGTTATTTTTLADTIKKLQQLQMDHKVQTLSDLGGAARGTEGGELVSGDKAINDRSAGGGGGGGEGFANSAHSPPQSGPQFSHAKPVSFPSRFRWSQIGDPRDWNSCSAGWKSTLPRSHSQNGNCPQAVDDEDDDFDESVCHQECSSGFSFKKTFPEMSASAPVAGASAKLETSELYFGRACSENVLLNASGVTSTPLSSAGIATSTDTGDNSDTVNSASENSQIQANCEQMASMSNSLNCSKAGPARGIVPEVGAASSSLVQISMGPCVQVTSSHFCGVGARPKVPLANKMSSSVDLKDERKVGTSLKEGLNSAVCTIKSLCRVGFGAVNKDASLDVNANDNGAAGGAASPNKETFRSASVPAPSGRSQLDSATVGEAVCRSVGTSPLMFSMKPGGAQETKACPSVWSNFSFNDTLLPQSSSSGASGGVFGSPDVQNQSRQLSLAQLPFEATSNSSLTDQAVGATARWKSLQLKWDSNETLTHLSKTDVSDFWTLGMIEDGKEGASESGGSEQEASATGDTSKISAGEVSAMVAEGEIEEPKAEQFKPAAVVPGINICMVPMSFDYVSTVPSRPPPLGGSPKYRQRLYLKTRKRNQQSK